MSEHFEAAKRFNSNFRKLRNRHALVSMSGSGSSHAAAEQTKALLEKILPEVKTILDLGCGDWFWMKTIDFSGKEYQGWDADEAMIGENIAKYGADNIKFFLKDIFNEPLPKVDLVICRDVFIHFPLEDGAALVEKIKGSAEYLLSTNHPKTGINHYRKHDTIKGWGYHPANMDIAPYNLGEFKQEQKFEKTGGVNKAIALYKFS